MTSRKTDPKLEIISFASSDLEGQLTLDTKERSFPMVGSSATGQSLLSNGQVGADIIHVKAGGGFVPHTHSGDHLLFVMAGHSTITFAGAIYEVNAGQCYMVEGLVPHAVGAITDTVILAIGSPHQPVDSKSRMKPVAYTAVLSTKGVLNCNICEMQVDSFHQLHELSCPHCPCITCVSPKE